MTKRRGARQGDPSRDRGCTCWIAKCCPQASARVLRDLQNILRGCERLLRSVAAEPSSLRRQSPSQPQTDCDRGRLDEDNCTASCRNAGRTLFSSTTEAAPALISWMDLIINISWGNYHNAWPEESGKAKPTSPWTDEQIPRTRNEMNIFK